MKLILDTSLPKMLLILLDDKKVIFSYTSEEQKKADLLPIIFEEMIKKTKIKTKDIKEFYITTGEGSFMGSRTALTFARTMAQITGAKLFVTSPLSFVGYKSEMPIFLDAKGGKSYKYNPKTKKVSLVNSEEDSVIDYEDIVKNPHDYLGSFKEVDVNKVKASYLRDPKIGGN